MNRILWTPTINVADVCDKHFDLLCLGNCLRNQLSEISNFTKNLTVQVCNYGTWVCTNDHTKQHWGMFN